MSWWERYKLWLEVQETGGGWFVERDGRSVALLTEPQLVDMFWYAWKLEPLVEDPAGSAAILSREYWDWEFLPRTHFRSREYRTLTDAFWSGDPVRDGRLVMRGLYQPIAAPWPWDEVVLWVRGWLRRRRLPPGHSAQIVRGLRHSRRRR
jgi:hypothetical protein